MVPEVGAQVQKHSRVVNRPEVERVDLLRKLLELGGHHEVRKPVKAHIHLYPLSRLAGQRLHKALPQSIPFPDEGF